jgi:hypothetical protein
MLAGLLIKPAKVAIAALLSLTLVMVLLVMLLNHLRPAPVKPVRDKR